MTRVASATIHLSGPLAGCNESQRTRWRAEFKRLCHGYECIDPSEWGADWDFSRDLDAVDRCDVLVANMWKESIGTTLEIMHARSRGKPVVLLDPNFLDHPILAGLIAPEKPVRTVAEAARRVKALISAWGTFEIEKKDGSLELFVQEKLVRAVRLACADAGVNDLEFPNQVVRATVEALRPGESDAGRHHRRGASRGPGRPGHGGSDDRGQAPHQGPGRGSEGRLAAARAVQERRCGGRRPGRREGSSRGARARTRAGNEGLQRGLGESDRRLRALERRPDPAPAAAPATLFEAVGRLAREYANAIVVHPRALRSAKESPYRDIERAWTALDLLGRYARSRLEAATGVGHQFLGASEWFRDRRDEAPWLTYKPHESQTSKSMWDGERTVEWEDEQLLIEQHLCVGTGSAADLLRVHFAVHQGTGVVVVGHCGKHLTNTLS